MIRKSDLFCQGGEIRTDTLLTPLILVQRDVKAEPPVILQPRETAFHPAPGKLPVLIVGKAVIMGGVLNVHVVGGGCDE